jgi:hypothetical protein
MSGSGSHTAYYYERILRQLAPMVQVHNESLVADASAVDAPEGALKVHLRSHQKTVLAAMERQEQQLTAGRSIGDQKLFSNYGILGDSVGVGKSLMILGHIARVMRGAVPPIGSHTQVDQTGGTLFTVRTTPFTDLSEAGCLIVIPHTLYRQWADYVKKQTNLKAVFLDKAKAITEDTPEFLRDVLAADLVLVSNTMYKYFSMWQRDKGLRWKRFFLDEADTIHIVSGYPYPTTRFSWLVSASWINLLYPNQSIYCPNTIVQQAVFAEGGALSMLRETFRGLAATGAYTYLRYYVRSTSFLRNILNETNSSRGYIVTRCSDQYIKDSISLPTLIRHTILCKPSLTQQMVHDIVPDSVRHLLHAGDTQGAIEALGMKMEDTGSIVEAVTTNLQKELTRLEATRAFKESLEYSTPRAKEEALKTLDDKITKTKQSIQALKERIENFKQDTCPICYDDPQEPLLTPCCNRVFCGQCLLTCMTRSTDCPMCRNKLHPNQLVRIVSDEEKNKIVASGSKEPEEEDLKKKPDALLHLFKQNPQGRFLVFSRYDNPFTTIEAKVAALGVKVRQLKGNKDVIAATLRHFQAGEIKCLLLNSSYAGAGLNITAATHVILLHAMTLEEEKQILGRAYRMGRQGPLTFIKLLHPDEMPPADPLPSVSAS